MSQENLAMVLAAYQRRKNLENMVAPLVSICIHILVALGLLLFYKPAVPQDASPVVEVKMQEEEIIYDRLYGKSNCCKRPYPCLCMLHK